MRGLATVGLTCCLLAGPAFPDEQPDADRKSIRAARTSSAPTIDGRLDDAVWQAVAPDDSFTQHFPDEGKAPSERTEVRVLYDDDAVYIGVRLYDDDPSAIVARLTRRDRQVESDNVTIGIDSRHDHDSAFVFTLNAAGVQQDGLVYDDTNMNDAWDAVWDGATSRDLEGWSAEFRIPLSILRFSSAERQVWGFQVLRYISRRQETDLWTFKDRTTQAEVSILGHLVGLEGLRPRRTLELRPFGVTRIRARTSAGGAFLGLSRGAEVEGEETAGLDLKLGVTSELTLDATINPDFGQVEADQVVLNLSRFESFFPEKRPFFLEGAELWETPLQLFYSRRVGRPPSGLAPGDAAFTSDGRYLEVADAPTALPIWTAAKLTGKVGARLSVGVLEAITAPEEVRVLDDDGPRDERLAPIRSYAAVRARWLAAGASYVGLLATAVTRLGGTLRYGDLDHDAFAQGVDAQWQTAGGRLRLTGQLVLSERVGGTAKLTVDGIGCTDPSDPTCTPIVRADGTRQRPGDVGFGAVLKGRLNGKHVVSQANYQALSPTLDLNDMGFVPNFNQHRLDGFVAWQETQPKKLQYWLAGMGGVVQTTFDGVPIYADTGLNVELQTKGFLYQNFNLFVSAPGTWDVYETGDGARFESLPVIGGGTFVSTDSRKRVQVSGGTFANATFAGQGWGAELFATINLRLLPQLDLELDPQLSWTGNTTRFYFDDGCRDDAGEVCTVDSMTRHYRFGALDYGSLSFTLRTTYTFSPKLSLQGYAQLFLSEGSWRRYYTVDTMGTSPEIARDDLVADPTFIGDNDGDRVRDDGFQDLSLNVNVVLRWEMLPGSTLLGVYTRSQAAAYDLAGRSPRFQLGGLSTGPTEEVFLLKLVYFLS